MEQIRAKATRDPLALSGALQRGASKLGLPEFKPVQREAIHLALCGWDVFVTLPTGSAIYQALPYCVEALGDDSAPIKPVVLVVSPLIALMRDQVTSLKSKGIKATYLGNHCSAEEHSAIVGGEFSHLFTSPETILQVPEWRKNLLSTGNLIAIAIDEAHCIVKWGMGDVFREWYGKVSQLRSLAPNKTPVLALTAMSTLNVRSCNIWEWAVVL